MTAERTELPDPTTHSGGGGQRERDDEGRQRNQPKFGTESMTGIGAIATGPAISALIAAALYIAT